MSNAGREERSFRTISDADLRRLAKIAADDRKDFFKRHQGWAALYRNRVLCTALCQGAALHYVNGHIGINDFDVYTFYSESPRRRWYAKALRSRDFGSSKFGQTKDRPNFVGRRVDLMGRSLAAKTSDDPVVALRRYLQESRTRSAQLLAEKAVVILEPARIRGTVVWPVATSKAAV